MAEVIVDTSALLAFFDASEPDHAAVSEVIRAANGPLIISPFVIAELDYLVTTRHGVDAELAVLDQLAGGAWQLVSFGVADMKEARSIIASYDDQEIGVADASNVVLAQRHRTRTILTLDRKHFAVLRSSTGDPFTVLPEHR